MFTDAWTTIYHGDCLTVMRGMEACSIDAIVTDPPYGLSFMGREWDHGVPGEPFWAEALRVAKPGAHLVAFGGTRTYHRLAVAIEDAGWEVRDCLGWLYGSGFPKSLDVSKAIDKRGGAADLTAEVGAAIRRARIARGMTVTEADRLYCGGSTLWTWYEGRPAGQQLPTPSIMDAIARDWPELADYAEAIAQAEREKIGERDGSLLAVAPGQDNDRSATTLNITAPATEAAQRWQGWGTALKPAWEPVILARKPLTSTVAANVQRWGTGAINIDGCRIETDEIIEQSGELQDLSRSSIHDGYDRPGATMFRTGKPKERSGPANGLGRWPANIVHDGSDEVLAVFPQTSSSPFVSSVSTGKPHDVYGGGMEDYTGRGFSDSGSAARFFYTAKASKSERDDGLRFDRNTHPTVKPLDLMRWLVRLVTPPDGVVLDPFMGSGTTLKAARAEGHRSIGIDLEREHCEIAWGRLSQGVLL